MKILNRSIQPQHGNNRPSVHRCFIMKSVIALFQLYFDFVCLFALMCLNNYDDLIFVMCPMRSVIALFKLDFVFCLLVCFNMLT